MEENSLQVQKQKNSELVANVKSGVQQVGDKALAVAEGYFISPPPSLDWMFGLGFKVGLLILLKSVIVMHNHLHNLTQHGLIMVSSQVVLALILVAAGIVLQNPSLYSDPVKLRRGSSLYLVAALVGGIVDIIAITHNWQYFHHSKISSLKTFFTSVSLGTQEVTLKVIFSDAYLWVAFSLLLFVISLVFLITNYGAKSVFTWSKLDKQEIITLLRVLAAIIVVVALIIALPNISHISSAQIESDLRGQSYTTVVDELHKKGFKNIEVKALSGNILNKENNQVKSILVNGSDDYTDDDWISKRSSLVVECFANRYGIKKQYIARLEDVINLSSMLNQDVTIENLVSSNNKIVQVVDAGIIEVLAYGDAELSYSIDGVNYSCLISVDKTISEKANDIVDTIKDKAQDAIEKGKETIDNVKDGIGDKGEEIKDSAEKAKDGLKDTAEKVKDNLKDATNKVEEGIKDVTEKAGEALTDLTDKFQDMIKK